MTGNPKKILAIEDSTESLKILETILLQWGYDVVPATNGSEAWDLFNADSDIQMIVSDWMMPGIDGIDLCRMVRSAVDRRYTYIILLTAKTDIEDVIRGLEAGADDFVKKPYNHLELKVRVRAGERVIDLENQLANKVDELSRASVQMRNDLTAAEAMQRSMLPPSSGMIKGVRYSSCYIPSVEIGGDLFNLMELSDSQLGIYIFDVSGHGVPAALQSVAMGRMLSPYDPHASILLGPKSINGTNPVLLPRKVTGRLNAYFQSASSKGDFITFLYGILEPKSGLFTYTCAGHPDPVLISNGSIIEISKKDDIPIGIVPHYIYEENILKLSPGDRLFFYTDGIPEAANPQGDRFTENRMLDHLAQSSNVSIDTCISTLIKSVTTWIGKSTSIDDMTILGVEM